MGMKGQGRVGIRRVRVGAGPRDLWAKLLKGAGLAGGGGGGEF